jgi:COMPASS component SWD3
MGPKCQVGNGPSRESLIIPASEEPNSQSIVSPQYEFASFARENRSLFAVVKDRRVFNPDDPSVKNEIIQIIVQYLQDEGYLGSSVVIQDEANVMIKNIANKRSQLRRIKRALLSGEWAEVENILAQKATLFRHQNQFLYAVYKQQYLELIDSQQSQKALFLLKRLKPLERYEYSKNEFRDLCYLLTCQSVSECEQFADWDGANASRAALVDRCDRLLEIELFLSDSSPQAPAIPVHGISPDGAAVHAGVGLPPSRLIHLIQQALAFQVESAIDKLRVPPRIGSILEDYECLVVPNVLRNRLLGHRGNVKSVTFVGRDGRAIATGSSDNTARLWRSSSGEPLAILSGHRSRVWDVSAGEDGSLLATGGGDGTVRLWNSGKILSDFDELRGLDGGSDTPPSSPKSLAGSCVPVSVLGGNGDPDVYAVQFHPNGQFLMAGGYDNDVRLYDVEKQRLVHCFTGHTSSVSCIAFNGSGTMAITGSKDATVRYWDVLSGLCIKTISSHLGEVTSVSTNAAGTLMITGSKDNSNRLWDVRQCKPIRRYKRHQNTSRNFVRAAFGPRERLIIGGSEDGFVYIWDTDTQDVVKKLGPAGGPVYSAQWNTDQSLLVSCSHDGSASTWQYSNARGAGADAVSP